MSNLQPRFQANSNLNKAMKEIRFLEGQLSRLSDKCHMKDAEISRLRDELALEKAKPCEYGHLQAAAEKRAAEAEKSLAAARADRERLTNEIGLHLSWMEDAGEVFHGIMRDESLPRGLRDQAAKLITDFDEYSAALSSPLPAEEAKKPCGESFDPRYPYHCCSLPSGHEGGHNSRPAEGAKEDAK